MDVNKKRQLVSDLAIKLFASGSCSMEEASIIAHAAIEEFDDEWNSMTLDQRLMRFLEATKNINASKTETAKK